MGDEEPVIEIQSFEHDGISAGQLLRIDGKGHCDRAVRRLRRQLQFLLRQFLLIRLPDQPSGQAVRLSRDQPAVGDPVRDGGFFILREQGIFRLPAGSFRPQRVFRFLIDGLRLRGKSGLFFRSSHQQALHFRIVAAEEQGRDLRKISMGLQTDAPALSISERKHDPEALRPVLPVPVLNGGVLRIRSDRKAGALSGQDRLEPAGNEELSVF